MRKISKKKLKEILENHKLWLNTDKKEGQKAVLTKLDLSYVDLSGVNLRDANLSETNLYHANFSGTNLSGADLRDTGLTESNLRKANLNRANLSYSFLNEADLCEADLIVADLSHANLSHSDLSYANLSRTDLSDANMRGANLYQADLSHSDLRRADLSHADMSGVDLCDAHLWYTIFHETKLENPTVDDTTTFGFVKFANVDLGRIIGLEKVRHIGPSTIGIDTIYKSKGRIPKVFLKGAGVPENFTEYEDSFINPKPIDYYSCFISYSRRDEEFVKRLHADMQAKNIRCWLDQEDLKIGDKTRQVIHESIRLHDKLLIVLSEESINSSWVEDEVNTAFAKERKNDCICLFPIRIDQAVMETDKAWAETIRNDRHIGDFCNWKNHDEFKKAFERLLRDLKLT